MKPEERILFEKIIADVNSISAYICWLLQEDIDLDATKTYSIDYSQYAFLQEPDYVNIKTQIIYDSSLATQARIRGDFIEFCRYLCLQMELLLSHFYTNHTNRSDDPEYLKHRLNHFIKEVCRNQVDRNIRRRLSWAIDIRNIASHRDTSGFPIEKRIEKAGHTISLYFNQMKSESNEIRIQNSLKEQLKNKDDWDSVKVTYRTVSKRDGSEYGYAYVDIYGVRLELTTDEVKNKVEKILRLVHPQYGNNVKIEFNKNQVQKNELNSFFIESNYVGLQQAFFWLLEEFDRHYP